MSRKLWALCALGACAVGAALPGGAGARSADCRPVRAIFYASTDWLRLAQALAANPSPCAQYFVSVPPPNPDKATFRGGTAAQIRALGPTFHALAEINLTAWSRWVATNGSDWYSAGLEARKRMAAAGFDVGQGDSWALNELPSAARTTFGQTRQNMRDFLHGLYDGGGSPEKGVVFAQGTSQTASSVPRYKANLESWFQDAGFWTDVGTYVSDFMQENYGDARAYGVSGAIPTTRLQFLNQYLQQDLALATAAPPGTPAQSVLAATYGPLATAAWPWGGSYGYTQVSSDEMEDFVTAEIAAMDSYDASLGLSSDRIGLAWAPHQAASGLSAAEYATETKAILDRMAAAIADPTCEDTWCTAAVDGAAFTERWSTFGTWTPTAPAFTSARQSLEIGAASAPVTVQLRTGLIATSLPYPVELTLATSSPSAGLATTPGGPWAPTLELTLPAGASRATVYVQSTAGGTPAVSVTGLGVTKTQVETALAPSAAGSSITLPNVVFVRRAGRLGVTLRILDAAGLAVPQASISFSIVRGTTTFAASVAHTNAAGKATVFAFKKPIPGCYTVHVKAVRVAGYTWRLQPPPRRYCVS